MLEIIGDKQLYQWDMGRTANVNVECNEVHFSNLKFGTAFSVDVRDGVVVIPNEVLMTGADIYAWAFVITADGGYTKKEQTLAVTKRAKPSDYVYTPTEAVSVKEIKKRLDELEVEVDDFQKNQKELQTQIAQEKADRETQDNAILAATVQAIQGTAANLTTIIVNEQNERARHDGLLKNQLDLIIDNREASKGLSFDVTSDDTGTYATVVGIGECLDKNIVIPEEHVLDDGTVLPVKAIGARSFSNNPEIASVVIPSSIVSIKARAFYNCENLKFIMFRSSVPPVVNRESLIKSDTIYVPYESVENYKNVLTGYSDIIQGFDTLKNLNDEIKKSAQELQDQINEIKPKHSEGLRYILVDGGTAYGISDMGSCTDENVIIPPSHEGLPVTTLCGGCFMFYSNIVTLTLPDTITLLDESGCAECKNLKTVICYADTPPTLHNIGFFSGTALSTIYVPYNSVEAYKTATNWSNYAEMIKPIDTFETLRADIDKLKEGGGSGANYDAEIADLQQQIDTIKGEEPIASEGLAYRFIEATSCYAVSAGTCQDVNIVIPPMHNGYPVEQVADEAFFGYSDIKTITLSENIKYIGTLAFAGCASLESIICYATTPPVDGEGLINTANYYVPEESLDAYKEAWVSVADKINPIVPQKVPSLMELQRQIEAINETLDGFINVAEVGA